MKFQSQIGLQYFQILAGIYGNISRHDGSVSDQVKLASYKNCHNADIVCEFLGLKDEEALSIRFAILESDYLFMVYIWTWDMTWDIEMSFPSGRRTRLFISIAGDTFAILGCNSLGKIPRKGFIPACNRSEQENSTPSLKLPDGNYREHGKDGDLCIHRDVAADQSCRAPVLPRSHGTPRRRAPSWMKSLGKAKIQELERFG